MKKILSFVLVAALTLLVCVTFTACEEEEVVYTIGIIGSEIEENDENAVQGFKDSLRTELGDEVVEFTEKNIGENKSSYADAVEEFEENEVDLIFAYGDYAVSAVAEETEEIPVIGACVSDYVSLLEIEDYNGVIGGNVSGINSFPAFEDQVDFIKEVMPEVKTVAVLYCSNDTGASYKASMLRDIMGNESIGSDEFVFDNEENVAETARTAAYAANVVFVISGENTNSLSGEISEAVRNIKTPFISDSLELCEKCSCAGIYVEEYEIGVEAGKTVSRILTGIADVSKIQTGNVKNVKKAFNKAICEMQGVDTELIDTSDFVEVEAPEGN